MSMLLVKCSIFIFRKRVYNTDDVHFPEHQAKGQNCNVIFAVIYEKIWNIKIFQTWHKKIYFLIGI